MMYIDQKVDVYSEVAEPVNGVIRVRFSGIVLSLSIVKADWLAENIRREIRKVEAEHPDLVPSLFTDDDRKKLKRGDVVRVRDDQGIEADYEVKMDPWQLGSGHWVIGLKGISGGYSLDRVVCVVRYSQP